jgi:hypothetical protein
MPKYKIAIGLTSGADSRIHWQPLISAFQAMSGRDWSDYELTVLPSAGLYINLNRNEIADTFLHKTECDYLLYIDHDNGFFPDFLDLFMEDMADPEVKIVSGVYYLKQLNSTILVAGQKPKGESVFRCDHYPQEAFAKPGLKNISKDFSSDGGLVGAGMLMLKRELLEEMTFPWFDSRFHNVESAAGPKLWYFLGEDNFFCMKAQEEGFDIYLDTRIRSPHMQGGDCYPRKWKQYKEARLCT